MLVLIVTNKVNDVVLSGTVVVQTTTSRKMDSFSKELAKDRLEIFSNTNKGAKPLIVYFNVSIYACARSVRIRNRPCCLKTVDYNSLFHDKFLMNNKTKLRLMGLTDRQLLLQASDFRKCVAVDYCKSEIYNGNSLDTF